MAEPVTVGFFQNVLSGKITGYEILKLCTCKEQYKACCTISYMSGCSICARLLPISTKKSVGLSQYCANSDKLYEVTLLLQIWESCVRQASAILTLSLALNLAMPEAQ